MGDIFSWKFALDIFPKVLQALPQTLLIVVIATVCGIFLGILLAFSRIERIPLLNQLSILLISFIRGTPILIQMFLFYFFIPSALSVLGIDISEWDKSIFIYITYSINTSAFFAEIFRSAILSVPKAQSDAAYSVGLSRAQVYGRIIIPQSISIAIPGIGVLVTSLLQDTSLAFTFGIFDVVGKARLLGQMRNRLIEGYVVSAVIFIVLSVFVERGFAVAEHKTKVNILNHN